MTVTTGRAPRLRSRAPDAFERWIFASYDVSPRGLGLFRVAYAAFALLVIAPGHDRYSDFAALAAFPDVFFVPPPGPMALLSGFPPGYVMAALEVLLVLALVAVLFGYRTRTASLLTGVLFLVGYGVSFSFGKVNHNLLFVLLPLVMAGTGWGAAYSYDARFRGGTGRSVRAWPLTLLAVLVGFAMFAAGFTKLLGGWLDPSTHAVLGHVVKQYFVRGRTDFLASYLVTLERTALWEVLDYATVVFELGFLFAVVRAGSTRVFAGLAVLFHFGILLALNIAFTFNLIVYAAFVDWGRLEARLRRRLAAVLRLRLGRWQVRAALAAVFAWFVAVGSPLLWLDGRGGLESDLALREVLVLAAAVLLVLWSGLRAARRRLAALRRGPVPA